MEPFMNSCHTFGQECSYGDKHRAGGRRGGSGEESADSIFSIFRLKSHQTLKDREEGAESQPRRSSGQHAQSHVSAVVSLTLLDYDVVDPWSGVSTWEQSEVI